MIAPRFITHLEVTPLSSGGRWRLLSELVYDSGLGGTIVVPRGFETDLASIPQIFWWFLSPLGRHQRAAVVHDWLYHRQYMSRAMADAMLREAMKVCKTPLIQRILIYRAVRMFGWLVWKQRRRK